VDPPAEMAAHPPGDVADPAPALLRGDAGADRSAHVATGHVRDLEPLVHLVPSQLARDPYGLDGGAPRMTALSTSGDDLVDTLLKDFIRPQTMLPWSVAITRGDVQYPRSGSIT
jgi:hypothetical protein